MAVFVFSLSGRMFIWLHNCASRDWGHRAWSRRSGFDCLCNPLKAWIFWIPENLTGAPREKKKVEFREFFHCFQDVEDFPWSVGPSNRVNHYLSQKPNFWRKFKQYINFKIFFVHFMKDLVSCLRIFSSFLENILTKVNIWDTLN